MNIKEKLDQSFPETEVRYNRNQTITSKSPPPVEFAKIWQVQLDMLAMTSLHWTLGLTEL
jgi:hypothetical protein